jgi:hypothetical protein
MTRRRATIQERRSEAPKLTLVKKQRRKSSMPPPPSRRAVAKGMKQMSTNPIEEIREENKRLAQAVQEWKPLAEADPSFGVLLLELEVLVDNVHERAMHGERLQEEVERLKREGAPESKVDRAVGEWEAGVDQTRGALDEAKTKRRAIEDAAKSVSLMPVVPTSAPLTPPPPAPVVGAGTAALTGTGGTGAGAPKGKGGAKAGKAAAVAAPVAAASPPMWPPGTPGGVGGPPRPPG